MWGRACAEADAAEVASLDDDSSLAAGRDAAPAPDLDGDRRGRPALRPRWAPRDHVCRHFLSGRQATPSRPRGGGAGGARPRPLRGRRGVPRAGPAPRASGGSARPSATRPGVDGRPSPPASSARPRRTSRAPCASPRRPAPGSPCRRSNGAASAGRSRTRSTPRGTWRACASMRRTASTRSACSSSRRGSAVCPCGPWRTSRRRPRRASSARAGGRDGGERRERVAEDWLSSVAPRRAVSLHRFAASASWAPTWPRAGSPRRPATLPPSPWVDVTLGVALSPLRLTSLAERFLSSSRRHAPALVEPGQSSSSGPGGGLLLVSAGRLGSRDWHARRRRGARAGRGGHLPDGAHPPHPLRGPQSGGPLRARRRGRARGPGVEPGPRTRALRGVQRDAARPRPRPGPGAVEGARGRSAPRRPSSTSRTSRCSERTATQGWPDATSSAGIWTARSARSPSSTDSSPPSPPSNVVARAIFHWVPWVHLAAWAKRQDTGCAHGTSWSAGLRRRSPSRAGTRSTPRRPVRPLCARAPRSRGSGDGFEEPATSPGRAWSARASSTCPTRRPGRTATLPAWTSPTARGTSPRPGGCSPRSAVLRSSRSSTRPPEALPKRSTPRILP